MKFLCILSIFHLSLSASGQVKSTSKADTIFLKDGTKKITIYSSLYQNNFLISENKFISIYYRNEKLKETYTTTLGELETGMHLKFYPNGQLQEVYNTLQNQIVGSYLVYYKSGKPKIIGEYKKINCLSELNQVTDSINIYDGNTNDITGIEIRTGVKSIKTGHWFYYTSAGKLSKQETF